MALFTKHGIPHYSQTEKEIEEQIQAGPWLFGVYTHFSWKYIYWGYSAFNSSRPYRGRRNHQLSLGPLTIEYSTRVKPDEHT
tara:strand:+ start:745 stop:990 length:246 start_codon:yes stop_codon:yes gene_type:complete